MGAILLDTALLYFVFCLLRVEHPYEDQQGRAVLL